MLVMAEVSIQFHEARKKISTKLNENGNILLENRNGDIIMRAIQFIIDPKYEFAPEINELFKNDIDIQFVKILFHNKDKKFRLCKDEHITVVRYLSQNLKTVKFNNKRLKLKSFYSFLHQDYEIDGELITRPYIITGKDADVFKYFSSTQLFNFISSAVTLNQQINMRESHEQFITRIKSKMENNSIIIKDLKKKKALDAITVKYNALTKHCSENKMLSTAHGDTMDKHSFLNIKSSIDKAEKWFKVLVESNVAYDGFKLKFFLITDEERFLDNKYFQMDVLKKLTFSVYDKDGNKIDTTKLIQLIYMVYISLCLGLMEQIGFPYFLISIQEFSAGFYQKIEEIIVEMNTQVQFVILKA